MSYSRNFGMRSFENIVRTARFRVPASGNPFKIGAPVMIDAAAPGRLKAATANLRRGAGCGLVVFEHIQNKSDALVTTSDAPYNEVPLNVYAQMIHGLGAKVWFRQTADKTLYDGRVQAGYSLLADDVTAVEVGEGLSPDGSGKLVSETLDDDSWFVVEQVNDSTGLVEARFTF